MAKYKQIDSKAKAASAAQSSSQAIVTLVLDMEPKDFRKVENEFVKDLSELMGYEPSRIEILDVRKGCTEADIRIPVGGKDLINILKTKGKDWPEDVLEFLKSIRLYPTPSS